MTASEDGCPATVARPNEQVSEVCLAAVGSATSSWFERSCTPHQAVAHGCCCSMVTAICVREAQETGFMHAVDFHFRTGMSVMCAVRVAHHEFDQLKLHTQAFIKVVASTPGSAHVSNRRLDA